MLSDGSATYLYGRGAERLRAVNGPWYVGDALGSVRLTLNDAGAPLARAWYDPWGQAQGGVAGPFGFTGELQDQQGMVYLRARWYDPAQGTLLGRDPFAGVPEMPYSLHPYQYGLSNPALYQDPSGRLAIIIHGGYGKVLAGFNGQIHAGDPKPPSEYIQAAKLAKQNLLEGSVFYTGPGGVSPTGLADAVALVDSNISATDVEIDKWAKTIIETYDRTCGHEPIVVIGTSRGGSVAWLIADRVYSYREEVKIDLLGTIAPVLPPDVPRPRAFSYQLGQSEYAAARLPNVRRHLNFLSEQRTSVQPFHRDGSPVISWKEWPEVTLPYPESSFAGATNIVVPGTSHFSITDEEMGLFEKRGTEYVYTGRKAANIPWMYIRSALQDLKAPRP